MLIPKICKKSRFLSTLCIVATMVDLFFIFIGKVWKTRRRTDEQRSYCPTDHWAFSKECYFYFYILSLSVFVNWIIETLGAKLSGTIESFDTLTTANHFLYLLPNHNSYTKCYYGQYLAFIKSPSHELDGQYSYFLTYLCWMNMH